MLLRIFRRNQNHISGRLFYFWSVDDLNIFKLAKSVCYNCSYAFTLGNFSFMMFFKVGFVNLIKTFRGILGLREFPNL